MRLGRARVTEANVDLTPMVDVVLLLVVFFMLTTQFARSQQTPLDLPRQPGDEAHQPRQAAMVIDLAADGRLMILGTPTDLQTLQQDLERERAVAGADFDVVVRADRSASAAHLNALADTLARSGIRFWQLATASEGSASEGSASVRGGTGAP